MQISVNSLVLWIYIGFRFSIGYIVSMSNKRDLLIDISLSGYLIPIAGVAIVLGLETASKWCFKRFLKILIIYDVNL